MSRPLDDRNAQILKYLGDGYSQSEVALLFNVSQSRVSQIARGGYRAGPEARNRAVRRLIANHEREFKRLYAEERQKMRREDGKENSG